MAQHKSNSKTVLIILFTILYAATAVVSMTHAVNFFALGNGLAMAVTLAMTFEIGQAASLFSILTSIHKKQTLSWVLMATLTVVQVLGNVFSSYKYMILHSQDQIQYFTKSVLFFVQSPNQDYNNVMISYIIGAILPVVTLLMTSMIVRMLRESKELNSNINAVNTVVEPTKPVEPTPPIVEEPVKPSLIVEDGDDDRESLESRIRELEEKNKELEAREPQVKEVIKEVPVERVVEVPSPEKLQSVHKIIA